MVRAEDRAATYQSSTLPELWVPFGGPSPPLCFPLSVHLLAVYMQTYRNRLKQPGCRHLV